MGEVMLKPWLATKELLAFFWSNDFDVRNLIIDPQNPSTWYVHVWKNGIYKSTNYGKAWIPKCIGLPSKDVMTLIMDPKNPSTLFAGLSDGLF